MKRIGGLFESVIAVANLLAAAHAAGRGSKRFRPEAAAFFFALEGNVLRLRDELVGGTYRPGPYRVFRIRDPKPRLISAAPFRDRVVHHAVCRVIEPVFERTFIADSYACRQGKGTHAALARAQAFARRWPWVLKCDVMKFFPAIDHAVLAGLLARKIKCRPTLALLDRIVAGSNEQEPFVRWFPGDDLFTPAGRPRGIPIGNLTSQFFGNVMLDPLDHFLKEARARRGYLRYADDFLVFGESAAELHEVLTEIRAFLLGFRLALHPRKCQVFATRVGVPFLGWMVSAKGLRIRRATGRRIELGLRRLCEAYGRGDVGIPRVRASIMSWLGFLRFGNAAGLTRRLLAEHTFVCPSRSS